MSRAVTSLVLLCIVGCSDQKLATPTGGASSSSGIPSSSSGDVDSGSSNFGEWGDPTRTRRDGTLRIAQFNVRRFFDSTCDSNKCTGSDSFEEAPSPEQFATRAAQIATALAKLDADVITLAEVEKQSCLDAVQAKLKEAGKEYPVAHVADLGYAGSIDVAVLSRGKLDKVVNHRKDDSPTIFTRELPEVHLSFTTVGGGTKKVVVFAAHFLSKSNDKPDVRLAEATTTQKLMVAAGTANAGALVLLGGDLNDTPDSPPLEALEKDGALVRVAKDMPEQSQGTYRFNGVLQAIDHIFTTKAGASAYVGQSAKVVRDDSGGFGGSDHASIYADFTVP